MEGNLVSFLQNKIQMETFLMVDEFATVVPVYTQPEKETNDLISQD